MIHQRWQVRLGLCFALGALVTSCSPGSTPVASQPILVTTGLHLEAPWWEAIQVSRAQSNLGPTRTLTVVIPSDVLFATNSYSVDANGREVLANQIAPLLRSAESIELAGATDDTGTSTYNSTLGLQRANACKAILITDGVPEGSIRTISWGASHPVANENGPDPQAARAQDRRVTVIATVPDRPTG